MTEAAFFSNEATFGRVVSQLPLEWGLVARNTKYWLFRCLKLSVPPSLSREWEGLKSELITSDLMKACLYNETFLKIPKWWGSGTFWGKKKKKHQGAGKAVCQERFRQFHPSPTKLCLMNFFYLVVPELYSSQQTSNSKCFPEFQESL